MPPYFKVNARCEKICVGGFNSQRVIWSVESFQAGLSLAFLSVSFLSTNQLIYYFVRYVADDNIIFKTLSLWFVYCIITSVFRCREVVNTLSTGEVLPLPLYKGNSHFMSAQWDIKIEWYEIIKLGKPLLSFSNFIHFSLEKSRKNERNQRG